MDIRGYFAAGGSIKSEENKKNTPADKDNDKRANEDGKLPPPKHDTRKALSSTLSPLMHSSFPASRGLS